MEVKLSADEVRAAITEYVRTHTGKGVTDIVFDIAAAKFYCARVIVDDAVQPPGITFPPGVKGSPKSPGPVYPQKDPIYRS